MHKTPLRWGEGAGGGVDTEPDKKEKRRQAGCAGLDPHARGFGHGFGSAQALALGGTLERCALLVCHRGTDLVQL